MSDGACLQILPSADPGSWALESCHNQAGDDRKRGPRASPGKYTVQNNHKYLRVYPKRLLEILRDTDIIFKCLQSRASSDFDLKI